MLSPPAESLAGGDEYAGDDPGEEPVDHPGGNDHV
jgi:hypothetical protein